MCIRDRHWTDSEFTWTLSWFQLVSLIQLYREFCLHLQQTCRNGNLWNRGSHIKLTDTCAHMWMQYIITVGECENTDDKEEEHEAAETTPQIVLQACIAPTIHKTVRKCRKKSLSINRSIKQWKLVTVTGLQLTLSWLGQAMWKHQNTVTGQYKPELKYTKYTLKSTAQDGV